MRLLGNRPIFTLIRLTFLIGGATICFSFILMPIRVTGISMEPTYKDGEINFINKLAYRNEEPKRADVVGIRYKGKNFIYLKRIIALPGEAITIEKGKIYIGGVRLKEPYMKHRFNWNLGRTFYLGKNEYFVIGDNRAMEQEDHVFGSVKRHRIVGKVLLEK